MNEPLELADVAELYRDAPKMEGDRLNEGLPVGTRAPDFTLRNAQGEAVRLSDYAGRPVLLVFYPLDWSPGCSQQLELYQQEIDEFETRGVAVIGISVDSIYSHGAWAAVRGIGFPLLSDFAPRGAVAQLHHLPDIYELLTAIDQVSTAEKARPPSLSPSTATAGAA